MNRFFLMQELSLEETLFSRALVIVFQTLSRVFFFVCRKNRITMAISLPPKKIKSFFKIFIGIFLIINNRFLALVF